MAEQTVGQDEAAEILAIMTGGRELDGAVRLSQPPRVAEVVSRGDGEDEGAVPMVNKVFQDPGLMTIWDIKTGRPSLTSRNMLPTQLNKLGEDGKRMFTMTKPAIEPPVARVACLLGPNSPERSTYDSWGFPTCKKMLLSDYEMEQHMKHTHKRQWEAIQNVRERAEKEIDRELQRAILRQAGKAVGDNDDDENAEPRRRRARTVVTP